MIAVVCFVFSIAARAQNSSPKMPEAWDLEEWPMYVSAIVSGQRLKPGVYPALERIRLDRLPALELGKQVIVYGSKWKALDRGAGRTEKARRDVSLAANDELLALILKTQKLSRYKTIWGSTQALLAKIPIYSRLELSPLDPLFLKTEVGQKISSDVTKMGSKTKADSYLMHPEQRVLELFMNPDPKSNQLYRLVVRDFESSGGQASDKNIALKGVWGREAFGLQNDLIFPKGYLKGSFWEGNTTATSSNSTPFGVYPGASGSGGENSGSQSSGDAHSH